MAKCINKLSLNIQISTAILFNNRKSLSAIRLNITINNIPIEFNRNIKLLSLFIDDKLNLENTYFLYIKQIIKIYCHNK